MKSALLVISIVCSAMSFISNIPDTKFIFLVIAGLALIGALIKHKTEV